MRCQSPRVTDTVARPRQNAQTNKRHEPQANREHARPRAHQQRSRNRTTTVPVVSSRSRVQVSAHLVLLTVVSGVSSRRSACISASSHAAAALLPASFPRVFFRLLFVGTVSVGLLADRCHTLWLVCSIRATGWHMITSTDGFVSFFLMSPDEAAISLFNGSVN